MKDGKETNCPSSSIGQRQMKGDDFDVTFKQMTLGGGSFARLRLVWISNSPQLAAEVRRKRLRGGKEEKRKSGNLKSGFTFL